MLLRLTTALTCATFLAGCGTTTIVKTVTSPAATPTTERATADTDAPTNDDVTAEASRDAQLGDTLDLDVSGTTLALRPIAIIDPLAAGDFDEPEAGKRLVGLRLSIRNTGDEPYSDSLANGSTLVLRDDEQADPTFVSEGPCAGSFGSDLKLSPGDKRVGCIAFEVPASKRLRSFQFTGDSGFAGATGEWRLPSRRVGTAAATVGATSDALGSSEPEVTSSGSFMSCDANIDARAGSTTCPFAQNVFYEYFISGESKDISAYSPATGTTFDLTCMSDGNEVECDSTDGGGVRFPQSAVDNYSSSQAGDYAASHAVG